MRRLLLGAAVAAALSGSAGAAHAYPELCWAPANCAYVDGTDVCVIQTGPNHNWTETCVGRYGYRQCWETFPAPVECRYLPGDITR